MAKDMNLEQVKLFEWTKKVKFCRVREKCSRLLGNVPVGGGEKGEELLKEERK